MANGEKYKGNWFKDKYTGEGLLVTEDWRYKGDFLKGRKHGMGALMIGNREFRG